MDQRDWYFHQPVTEGEMDGVFADVEASDQRSESDKSQYGILSGLQATEDGGGPSMNIQVAAGTAIDKIGRRMFSGGTILQDITNDTAGVPTAPSSGNRRWVSIFARFGRDLSDPRIDGLSNPLFFKHAEALNSGDGTGTSSPTGDIQANVGKLLVISGAEDLISNPIPARPALSTNAILLADVLYTFGDTSFAQAQISTGRAERFAIHFVAEPQATTEFDGAVDSGVRYDLILDAPGAGSTSRIRVYTSTVGLTITNNALWLPESREWTPDDLATPMGKTVISGDGIRLYGNLAGFNTVDNAWQSEFDLLSDGNGGQSVLGTSGEFTTKGTTHAMWNERFVSDGVPNSQGSGFTFNIPFPSIPSSVTMATAPGTGAGDANISAISLFGINAYGGAIVLTPNMAATFTQAHRLVTATF